MAATVVWTGGLAAIVLLIFPASVRKLQKGDYYPFYNFLQNRLQLLGWFCVAVLILTGMLQLSASPNYQGFLMISNQWSLAILIKHLAIGVMIIINAYFSWVLQPDFQRLTLLKNNSVTIDEKRFERLERQSMVILRILLSLSAIVLGLTAWARTS